jgi:hypothetical protein
MCFFFNKLAIVLISCLACCKIKDLLFDLAIQIPNNLVKTLGFNFFNFEVIIPVCNAVIYGQIIDNNQFCFFRIDYNIGKSIKTISNCKLS